MKIPETVKIGPYAYTVERDPGLLTGDNRSLDGAIDYSRGTIGLNTKLSADREIVTLFHEVLHGIDDYMNLELSEAQIDSLAGGVVMFLRDNHLLREE